MLSHIDILGFSIPMRSVMINIGMILGIGILLFSLSKNVERSKIFKLIVIYAFTILMSFIGSRFIGVLMCYDTSISMWNNFINSESDNFSGYVLAYIIIFPVLYKLIFKNTENILQNIKPSVFYLSTQLFFNRIGCLMAGCCGGIEYSGLFSIHYSPTSVGVFPTQPMESFVMAVVFALSIKLYNNRIINVFCMFLMAFGLVTIISEAFMDNYYDTRICGITIPQWTGGILAIIGIILNTIIILKKEEFANAEKK